MDFLEGAEDAEAPDKMSKGKVLPIYQLKETRLDMKSGTVYWINVKHF